MKIFFLYSMLCLSFSLNAIAWSERGNGGNSIICSDYTQNKFYDAYEAEFRYGLRPVYPNPHLNCNDEEFCALQSITIARVLINRIPAYPSANQLKEFLLSRLNLFAEESNLLDNIVLTSIDDMGTAFIPVHCKLHQTIIQKRPRFPGDKRYIISNDQWKKLSPNHRAVGIIHELLYYYAIHTGRSLENSEGIRYFNGLVISGEISKLSSGDFFHIYNLVFKNHHPNQ